MQHVIRPRAQSEGRSRSQSPAPGPAPGLALSSGQREQLLQLFEQHGMEKRYLDTITERFQEGWPRARVARSLKAMGLKKGVLTENQVRPPPSGGFGMTATALAILKSCVAERTSPGSL